jgi:magnesium-transporting ATPase (P-type)
VWVLTGDKIETAINIGYSCRLLTNDLIKIIIDSKKEEEIINIIKVEDAGISKNNKYALIISGDALIQALNPNISSKVNYKKK